jgi:hypothetical protein
MHRCASRRWRNAVLVEHDGILLISDKGFSLRPFAE